MDLSFLPPEWQSLIHAITALIVAAGVLGAAVKRLIGDPKPTDTRFKSAVYAVLHVVDWLAINSETIRSKQLRARSVELEE